MPAKKKKKVAKKKKKGLSLQPKKDLLQWVIYSQQTGKNKRRL